MMGRCGECMTEKQQLQQPLKLIATHHRTFRATTQAGHLPTSQKLNDQLDPILYLHFATMSTFAGFKGDAEDDLYIQPPPTEPKNNDSSQDDKLTEQELVEKYHLSREQKAELRQRLKAEWTPKFLGKKYVKAASDDPRVGLSKSLWVRKSNDSKTFSNVDLPSTTRYRLIHPGGVFFRNFFADRSSFKGFKGGDVEPPPQPESPSSDEGDENLPLEELIKKHAISDERNAELRRSLKAEWTPKLLGKKYVKNTSDDPQVRNFCLCLFIKEAF
ncbi:MAG: hypothetical protein Q9204_001269 [Flavoplaca sp. TL-2023a]